MLDATWLIPAFPLAGFLLLVAFGRRLGEPLAGWLATGAMAGSFISAVAVFIGLADRDAESRAFSQVLFDWVPVGDLQVSAGFLVDPLSITMCLFVTGIGMLIHLYSIGYMHGDEHFSKFFVYLNLFAFSMLMLVLGDNLLLTFLGWEGVGACSYLLISFWFTEESNASAGKKAFVTNRVGDLGFMIAMFLLFGAIGSLRYADVLGASAGLSETTATAITLLLLVGAAGKSAQLPLYLWLPDAMAGPTPVSALIHAATMVTSGVYLLTRMSPVISVSADWAPDLIAWVGAITALFAATIAVAQNDIKKVLAYSTVSQLGYMVLAVGVGGYTAAIFHMITHAFFKALLFLGSGSVIHGMGGEQDMRRYGGLRKFMPITAITFIIGWLAIAGVPPFAGFWSKDEILLDAWRESKLLWVVGLITALLTAFYMSRQVFMTFFGERRARFAEGEPEINAHAAFAEGEPAVSAHATGDEAHAGAHHGDPHESPWQMTVPLVVLAGLAIVGGALNLPFADWWKHLEHWLEPSFAHAEHAEVASGTKVGLAVVAVIAGAIGIAIAAATYLKGRIAASTFELPILAKGWGYDAGVSAFMGGPGRTLFDGIARFDKVVIDGAVNGAGVVVRGLSGRLRTLQAGLVRTYAALISLGAVALLGYFLVRATF